MLTSGSTDKLQATFLCAATALLASLTTLQAEEQQHARFTAQLGACTLSGQRLLACYSRATVHLHLQAPPACCIVLICHTKHSFHLYLLVTAIIACLLLAATVAQY
jgi:hypothetical protein